MQYVCPLCLDVHFNHTKNLAKSLLINLEDLSASLSADWNTNWRSMEPDLCPSLPHGYGSTNAYHPGFQRRLYIDLSDFQGLIKTRLLKTLDAIKKGDCRATVLYCRSATDFSNIPGTPIAYQFSGKDA